MIFEAGHHRQNHIFAPMPGDDLHAHRQTGALFLHIPGGLIGEVFALNAIALFPRLNPGGSNDTCRHPQEVEKQRVTARRSFAIRAPSLPLFFPTSAVRPTVACVPAT